MFINGRPVTASGTLVVGPGEQAELVLPFGRFSLVFDSAAVPNIRLSVNPMQILFEGTDNPLGLGSTFKLPLTNGTAYLALAVYAMGEGSAATRIIHYTVS